MLFRSMGNDYSYTYLDSLNMDSNSAKTWYNQLFYGSYRQILVIPVNSSIVNSRKYILSYSVGDALLAPTPKSPSYNQPISARTISLTVINSASVFGEGLIYEFELYNTSSDLSSQNPVNSNPNVGDGEDETSWYLGAMPYNTAQVPYYYWRCRVRDGQDYSAWTSLVPFSLNEPLDTGGDSYSEDSLLGCFINIVLNSNSEFGSVL